MGGGLYGILGFWGIIRNAITAQSPRLFGWLAEYNTRLSGEGHVSLRGE